MFLAVVAALALVAGYFYYSEKPAAAPEPSASNSVLPVENKSLAEDKDYIKKRVDSILVNNPKVSEEYARDTIYEEIAFNEQNELVCKKIISAETKAHCHRLFLISK